MTTPLKKKKAKMTPQHRAHHDVDLRDRLQNTRFTSVSGSQVYLGEGDEFKEIAFNHDGSSSASSSSTGSSASSVPPLDVGPSQTKGPKTISHRLKAVAADIYMADNHAFVASKCEKGKRGGNLDFRKVGRKCFDELSAVEQVPYLTAANKKEKQPKRRNKSNKSDGNFTSGALYCVPLEDDACLEDVVATKNAQKKKASR